MSCYLTYWSCFMKFSLASLSSVIFLLKPCRSDEMISTPCNNVQGVKAPEASRSLIYMSLEQFEVAFILCRERNYGRLDTKNYFHVPILSTQTTLIIFTAPTLLMSSLNFNSRLSFLRP